MAIPLNTFSVPSVPAIFVAPLSDVYQPLTMRAPGGTAIGDGAAGREVQFWTVSYASGVISLAPASGIVAFTLNVPDVLSVCVAFDSNMAVAIAYQKADGSYLYYFNSVSAQYETLFFAGTAACRVAVDKTASFFSGGSDVIFAYSLAGVLYWRQQRDRYVTAYTVGTIPGGYQFRRLGPSLSNRLQFEMST